MFSAFGTRGRLHRSMSSRSIRRARRPPAEIIDPDVAKLHAAVAASRAMHSSHQPSHQSSAELKCSYNRVGGPTQVAIPRRRPKSSIQYTDDSTSTYGAPTVPPSTPLPFARAESISTVNDREFSAVLSPPAELNGLDGRDSSVPSSYRRLRKAKSMFSTRQRSSHITYSTPPLPRRDAMDLERSPRFALPRTMRHTPSFIRASSFQSSRAIRHAKSQDTAIQLARDQFLGEIDQAEARTRHSSLFVHRRRWENKPFRKTLRVTSASNIGTKPAERHGRRRTFSASFKNGLKRVFGLSKPVEQQSNLSDATDPPFPPVPIACNEISVNNSVHEYVEDPHCVFHESPPSRASLCTSKSRVTSWADSTVANTITARKPGNRQSLSLIEEHGDLNKQLPQHPSGAADQASPTPRKSTARRFNDWVDSHDLYSALMQQIGRQDVQNAEEEIIFGTVAEHRAVQARTSSALSRRSKYTVRRVPSGDSSTPGSFTTARAGDSSSPRKNIIRPLQYIPSSASSRRIQGQEIHTWGPRVDGKSPRSPCARGGDSDDETGSVIVVRYGGARMGAVSPSVYSRTTNGGTPTEEVIEPRYVADEPGTATIFTSQRAVYKSPRRSSSSSPLKTQVKPSLDWQQWISSQIERIESTSPTREHVREDAQFQEDDDEIFMGMMRRAPGPGQESTANPYIASEPKHNDSQSITDPRVTSQNNFSRPFSRSSSVRTILPSQTVEPGSTVKTASKLSAVDSIADVPSPPARVPSDRTLSPMRTRTANSPSIPDSPTPQRVVPDIPKRNLTQEQYRRYSARRPIGNGKPNSFRSMRAYRDFNALNNENQWRREDHENMMDEYHKNQDGPSTVSSKRMVEMFLNSRRRPAEKVLDGNAPGEAFI
ncbi:hypothetical protein N7481_005282 [Penicillium waksmanii]|uniref:uncharacterized protein n=1 Tax=Penicillium waksmanii TaxID=69791 RepID=UPI002547F76C|nr:uncharacterized protein N7481_005282 [Penicillium waksmanii]KAJ5983183.1 hypothetical protein N7481_005282 [Penicillium waksmanii]